jgi:SAM-dependent methyltransferase
MGVNGQSPEYHCWHASTREEALRKGGYLGALYGPYLRDGEVVDLGCGEGTFLLWLKQQGNDRVIGVERNEELCRLAESFGVPIVRADLLEYLNGQPLERAVYLYLDVMEHVGFDMNLEVLRKIPVGSRIIIQAPNTQSLLGHEFYFNVPSHVAAYSPHVFRQMLGRCGYTVASEGTVTGNHPPTWKNRLRALFIRKVLGIDPEKLHGGGNYFVVADRAREG